MRSYPAAHFLHTFKPRFHTFIVNIGKRQGDIWHVFGRKRIKPARDDCNPFLCEGTAKAFSIVWLFNFKPQCQAAFRLGYFKKFA